jgi:hypothetical protein
VFLSAVFCEIIVTINVSNGSRFASVHFGIAKVRRSIAKTATARFSSIMLPRFVENDK